jgi:diaminopimelate epimerase
MISYHLLSPAGNITALVTDPVGAERYAPMASEIMAADPAIEQVGFIVPGESGQAFRLEMMGGELCVNAALAAASLHARLDGARIFSFGTSGYASSIRAEVTDDAVALELSREIIKGTGTIPEGQLVDLEGILVILTDALPEAGNPVIRDMLERYGSPGCRAIAVVRQEEVPGGFGIQPLVWVADTGSLVRESACGSGSIAAAYLRHARGEGDGFSVTQPSGEALGIAFSKDDAIRFSGPVEDLGLRSFAD